MRIPLIIRHTTIFTSSLQLSGANASCKKKIKLILFGEFLGKVDTRNFPALRWAKNLLGHFIERDHKALEFWIFAGDASMGRHLNKMGLYDCLTLSNRDLIPLVRGEGLFE